jgi:hypothetical protein
MENYRGKRTIHIWQIENHNGFNVLYMYKPYVHSIQTLLENELLQPLFIKDYSKEDFQIDYKTRHHKSEDINDEDIIIWIGHNNIDNYVDTKNKNVYKIWFNTEPDYSVDEKFNEIWTYSKYIYNNYKMKNKQKKRFIPVVLDEKINVKIDYSSNKDRKLVFLGNLGFRPDKKDVLMKNQAMKENLQEIYDVWSDEDFVKLIKSGPNIFLNLMKSGPPPALNSARINTLLNAGCIIVSEKTNEIDEGLYKDMMIFCKLEEINDKYIMLTKKTVGELQEMQELFYANFRNKFSIENADNLIASG